jgi:hypothetical protein
LIGKNAHLQALFQSDYSKKFPPRVFRVFLRSDTVFLPYAFFGLLLYIRFGLHRAMCSNYKRGEETNLNWYWERIEKKTENLVSERDRTPIIGDEVERDDYSFGM